MSFQKAVLKLASENSGFREALKEELRKNASGDEVKRLDRLQKRMKSWMRKGTAGLNKYVDLLAKEVKPLGHSVLSSVSGVKHESVVGLRSTLLDLDRAVRNPLDYSARHHVTYAMGTPEEKAMMHLTDLAEHVFTLSRRLERFR